MMVTAKHHRGGKLATCDCIVESLGNPDTPLAVGIEDTRLRPHYQVVILSLANPMEVILKLPLDFIGGILQHLLKHLGGKAVGNSQVLRVARSAHPAEWPEPVVEEKRAHYILHIRRVAEPPVGQRHIRTGS